MPAPCWSTGSDPIVPAWRFNMTAATSPQWGLAKGGQLRPLKRAFEPHPSGLQRRVC